MVTPNSSSSKTSAATPPTFSDAEFGAQRLQRRQYERLRSIVIQHYHSHSFYGASGTPDAASNVQAPNAGWHAEHVFRNINLEQSTDPDFKGERIRYSLKTAEASIDEIARAEWKSQTFEFGDRAEDKNYKFTFDWRNSRLNVPPGVLPDVISQLQQARPPILINLDASMAKKTGTSALASGESKKKTTRQKTANTRDQSDGHSSGGEGNDKKTPGSKKDRKKQPVSDSERSDDDDEKRTKGTAAKVSSKKAQKSKENEATEKPDSEDIPDLKLSNGVILTNESLSTTDAGRRADQMKRINELRNLSRSDRTPTNADARLFDRWQGATARTRKRGDTPPPNDLHRFIASIKKKDKNGKSVEIPLKDLDENQLRERRRLAAVKRKERAMADGKEYPPPYSESGGPAASDSEEDRDEGGDEPEVKKEADKKSKKEKQSSSKPQGGETNSKKTNPEDNSSVQPSEDDGSDEDEDGAPKAEAEKSTGKKRQRSEDRAVAAQSARESNKPDNASRDEYGTPIRQSDVDELQQTASGALDAEELKKENERLKQENAELRRQLAQRDATVSNMHNAIQVFMPAVDNFTADVANAQPLPSAKRFKQYQPIKQEADSDHERPRSPVRRERLDRRPTHEPLPSSNQPVWGYDRDSRDQYYYPAPRERSTSSRRPAMREDEVLERPPWDSSSFTPVRPGGQSRFPDSASTFDRGYYEARQPQAPRYQSPRRPPPSSSYATGNYGDDQYGWSGERQHSYR